MDASGTNAQTGTVAIGYQALTALTSGAANTAIGYQAMLEHATGNNNTVIGYGAMNDSNGQAAENNTFVGQGAGAGGYSGAASSNTAIGMMSFGVGAKTAAAIGNTAVGRDSLLSISEGASNTGVGYLAGNAITTGLNNTIVGKGSNPSANNSTNQTVIGFGTTGVSDNSVVLGNAVIKDVYMGSDSGAVVHSGALVNGLTAINLTGNTTLALDTHSVVRGRYVTVSATGVITLPTVVIGAVFIIVNIAADDSTLLTVSPQSGDKFAVDIACAVGTNGKDIILTEATHNQGDFVKLLGISANNWAITEISGIWVDEA